MTDDREHGGGFRVALSAAGEQRRAALRSDLQRAIVRRRRARRVAQGACTAIAAALFVVLLEQQFGTRRGAAPDGPIAQVTTPPRPGGQPVAPLATEFVRTDPGIVARCAVVEREPTSAIYVGDRELQELLRANGREAGILRMGQIAMVTGIVPDRWEHE